MDETGMTALLCFGMGFSANALARRLDGRGWRIIGTSRSAAGAAAISALGHQAIVFDGAAPLDPSALSGVTHVLVSAPPGASGDPVLHAASRALEAAAPAIRWAGYLSTTGVYGDHAGGWVSEATALTPVNERSRWRAGAEAAWLDFGRRAGVPVQIFRLAGIYGPGRNQLVSLLDGTARRIVKAGQVFSRIHVDDIAGVLEASFDRGQAGDVFNVCDDEPAPPQDVVAYAASLLGVPPPPEEPFEAAVLSSMARSFYGESKRVCNARMKQELGYRLLYPTYREGLQALMAIEKVSS
jgi:nucleoside-diphosphate-sugar epimerase